MSHQEEQQGLLPAAWYRSIHYKSAGLAHTSLDRLMQQCRDPAMQQ